VAPFYCFSGRYLPSAQEWADALQIEIQAFTKKHWDRTPELGGEWSIVYAKKEPGAWIKTMGIEMEVVPKRVFAMPRNNGSEFDFQGLTITGAALSATNEKAWQWLRSLRLYLLRSWKRSFVQAIRLGTADIMARKHTVLAPFERVTFNQWQYFRLDERELGPPNKDIQWGDPRLPYLAGCVTWAATGPSGAKLYEIHVAPGLASPVSSFTIEELCEDLLVKMLTDHPDRPRPLPELAKQICSELPGLTERAFRRCLFRAQQQTGNRKWSEAGRRKFPQKSPHQT
jgi:hypothetical protein